MLNDGTFINVLVTAKPKVEEKTDSFYSMDTSNLK